MSKTLSTDHPNLLTQLKYYLSQDQLEEAKRVVNLLEPSIDSANDLTLLNTLALYYKKRKNYDQAARYSRKSLLMVKDLPIESKDQVAQVYLQFASLECEYQQYANARIHLAKFMDWLEKHKCKDEYLYGLVYSQLSKVSIEEDDIEIGLNYLKQSLSYFKKVLPNQHPIVIRTINKLTDLYVRIENYEAALKLQQDLQDLYLAENLKVSQGLTLIRTGEIYFHINLKEARSIIKKGLELLKGEPNQVLNRARAYMLLAELEENTAKIPRCITYYKKAYEELNGNVEENHFLIVFIYSKIGTLSFKTNELDQAKDYLEKGLPLAECYEKIKLQFLYALGKLYSNEQNYENANSFYQQFLQILDQGGKNKTKGFADTLQSLAFNLLEAGELDDALKKYLEAQSIYEKLSNCKEELGLTHYRIAHCYENKEKPELDKAELFYEKGFTILEKIRNKDILEEALAGIIEFYNRTNNDSKRKIYENKFVKLQNSN